jgi:hypothetical protein
VADIYRSKRITARQDAQCKITGTSIRRSGSCRVDSVFRCLKTPLSRVFARMKCYERSGCTELWTATSSICALFDVPVKPRCAPIKSFCPGLQQMRAWFANQCNWVQIKGSIFQQNQLGNDWIDKREACPCCGFLISKVFACSGVSVSAFTAPGFADCPSSHRRGIAQKQG